MGKRGFRNFKFARPVEDPRETDLIYTYRPRKPDPIFGEGEEEDKKQRDLPSDVADKLFERGGLHGKD
jgi:hypothetical protein